MNQGSQQPSPLNLGKIHVWPPKEADTVVPPDESKICLDKTLNIDTSNYWLLFDFHLRIYLNINRIFFVVAKIIIIR
jgi:hypothetical protein